MCEPSTIYIFLFGIVKKKNFARHLKGDAHVEVLVVMSFKVYDDFEVTSGGLNC